MYPSLSLYYNTFVWLLLGSSFLFPQVSALVLTPWTPPDAIVTAQLAALQQDNMNEVYKYASPSNKEQMGSIDQFGTMVRRSGIYRPLIRHDRATILLTYRAPVAWQGLVRVSHDDTIAEYWWSLSRCTSGHYYGCYMVDAVIPNL